MSTQSKVFSNVFVSAHIMSFLRGSQPSVETVWADDKALATCSRVSRVWERAARHQQDIVWKRVGPLLFPSILPSDNYVRECRALAALISANLEAPEPRFPETRTPLDDAHAKAIFLDQGPSHFAAVVKGMTIQIEDILTRKVAHRFDAQKLQGRLSTMPFFVIAEGKFVTLGKDLNNQYCFLIWDLEQPEEFRKQPLPGLRIPIFGAVGDKIICAERGAVENFSVFSLRTESLRSYTFSPEFRDFNPHWRGAHRIGGLNNLIFIASLGNMTELFDLAAGQSRGVRECCYAKVLQVGNNAIVRTKEYWWDVYHPQDVLNFYHHQVKLKNLDFSSEDFSGEIELGDSTDASLLFPFHDKILHIHVGFGSVVRGKTRSFTRGSFGSRFPLLEKFENGAFEDYIRFCDGKLNILAKIDQKHTLVTFDLSKLLPAVEEMSPAFVPPVARAVPAVPVAAPVPVVAPAPRVGQASKACTIL